MRSRRDDSFEATDAARARRPTVDQEGAEPRTRPEAEGWLEARQLVLRDPDRPIALVFGEETSPATRRRLRRAAWSAAALLALGGGAWLAFGAAGGASGSGDAWRTPEAGSARAAPAAAGATAAAAFGRIGDSLSMSIFHYRLRQRDFDAGRIDCAELGRGYRRVDDFFVRLAATFQGEDGSPESGRARRFRKLTGEVDEVNRQFDGSRCPRPR